LSAMSAKDGEKGQVNEGQVGQRGPTKPSPKAPKRFATCCDPTRQSAKVNSAAAILPAQSDQGPAPNISAQDRTASCNWRLHAVCILYGEKESWSGSELASTCEYGSTLHPCVEFARLLDPTRLTLRPRGTLSFRAGEEHSEFARVLGFGFTRSSMYESSLRCKPAARSLGVRYSMHLYP